MSYHKCVLSLLWPCLEDVAIGRRSRFPCGLRGRKTYVTFPTQQVVIDFVLLDSGCGLNVSACCDTAIGNANECRSVAGILTTSL